MSHYPEPTSEELDDLKKSWNSALDQPVDAQTKALALGVNFRLDVAKALKAAWKATVLYFKTKKIALAGGDFVEIAKIGTDVFSLVVATLDAVRQRMSPLEYIGCYVLACAEEPLTRAGFREAMDQFLADASVDQQPWYTGLSDKLMVRARELAADDQGYAELLASMKTNGWLIDINGSIIFRPQHFTWGLRADAG